MVGLNAAMNKLLTNGGLILDFVKYMVQIIGFNEVYI